MKPRNLRRASVRWGVAGLVVAAMLAGTMGGCDQTSDDTGGTGTQNGGTTGGAPLVTGNDVPDLTFTKPNSSRTVYVGQPVEVAWFASDYDNATVTTLYYDRDGLAGSGDEMQLTQVQKPAKDYSESSFTWDTSQLAPGTYRLLATVTDGVNPPVTVYNSSTLSVVASTPTLNVVEPFGPKSVMPAENVVINWTQFAPLGPSTVTLFFDTNTSYSDGITNTITTTTMQPSDTGGSYVWNVPAVRAGQYYIGAVLSDGTHPPVVAYANGVLTITGPTVQVLAPSMNVQWHSGGSVQIRYQVSSAHGGTVRIFYDRDGVAGSGDEKWLPYSANVVPQTVTWTWINPALPQGAYHIGVEVTDGVNDPIVGYASGLVTEAGPTVTVTAPTGVTNWQGGGSVAVTYTVHAANGTVEVFYDLDRQQASGDEVMALGPLPIQNGIPATQTLTVATLDVGTYNVGVKLSDGVSTLWAYAPGTIVVGPPPPLTLTAPAAPQSLSPGAQVSIAWTNVPTDAVTLDLFYDVDRDATNGTSGTIATGIAVNPTTYTWTLPSDIDNPPAPAQGYYIGAIVTDGQGPQPAVYAPGLITIIGRSFYSYSLGSVEDLRLGRTLRGADPNGRLGQVVAHVPWKEVPDPKDPTGTTQRLQPGISMNPDANDDFIVTAPKASPFSMERLGAGASYLILSQPSVLFNPPAVGPFLPISVSATGTARLPGTVFAGPAYFHTDPVSGNPGTTEGIGAVALSRRLRQDDRPAVVFGIPYVSPIIQEEQDYDPWDQVEYDMLAGTPDRKHFRTAYSDTYRRPYQASDSSTDGQETNRANSGWESITAGMLIAVSGDNPCIRADLSQPLPQQHVIPLDNAGQLSPDPRAEVVKVGGRGALGTRFYCPWWFNDFTTPPYARYSWGSLGDLPGKGDNGVDKGYYGQSVIEADLTGDGYPEWIATQPRHHSSGAVNEGWLHITETYGTLMWEAPIPGINALAQMPSTWTVWLTTETITWTASGTAPNITYTESRSITGPTQFPVPAGTTESVRCWSWPYVVASPTGRANLTLVVDPGHPGPNPAPGNPPPPAAPHPASTTLSPTSDTRDRYYCWPVLSDYIRGDTVDAPAGNLSGLANVGDFNKDGREDITVGAPAGNPGGNKPNAGCVYLIRGSSTLGDLGLASIGTGVNGAVEGLKIVGETAGDLVGSWQASAGDFNGDTYSDWIIGAPGYDGNRGLVAIIYGSNLQGKFTLSDIGTKLPGIVFVGEAPGAMAGTCVAGLGDIDNDGYDDVGIVAPFMDWTHADGTVRTQSGVVYVIYGQGKNPVTNQDRQSTTANPMLLADVGKGNLPGLIYVGSLDNQQVMTVAPAGDIDADGFADFLIGNPNYDERDSSGTLITPDVGEVYVIRGRPRPTP